MIATMDELVAALAQSQSLPFRKNSVTLGAYMLADTFHLAGVPGAASIPTTVGANGEFPSSATAGALPFNDPEAGELTHIGRMFATSNVASAITLYDRIWHNYLLAFGTAKIPITWPEGNHRNAADPVELYAVIYTTLANTTAATWTVEFLDQDDVLRTATASYASNGTAGRLVPFDLPAGVTAIKEIVSFQSSVAQASGAIGLVLVKRLVELPIAAAGVPVAQEGISLGLPMISAGACLGIMVLMGSSTASGAIVGRLDLVQG